MTTSEREPQRTPTLSPTVRRWAVVAATLVALAISVVAFVMMRRFEQRNADSEFRRRSELHLAALQLNVQQSFDSLDALRILFQVHSNVSRAQFAAWAWEVTSRHPEIQVVEWCPRISAAERNSVETNLRGKGFPDFEVFERDAARQKLRAAERAEYFPIIYAEPLPGNRGVVGFDVAAGVAAADVVRARDTGLPQVSAAVPLVQSSNRLGVIVTLPVYARRDLRTLEERRAQFAGVLRGVFLVHELFEASWRGVPMVGVDTLVIDSSMSASNRVLHFHQSRMRTRGVGTPSEQEIRAGVYHEKKILIAGREWLFFFRPVPSWWHSQLSFYPYSLLLGGVSFALMLFAYLRTVTRRTEVVETLVAERTSRLEEANAKLNREIAERRRTQAKLLDAQRIGRIGSWEVDLIHDTLEWSDEVFRIFGRDREKFKPTNNAFFEAVHPDDLARVKDAAFRAIETGEPYDIQHRVRRPDGSERVVLEHAEMVRDGTGKVTHMRGTVQDITDRKAAEEKLTLERRLLETIIESLPDLIFVKDCAGRYVRLNAANSRVLGVASPPELIGKTDADVLPAELASAYAADDERVLESGEPLLNREEPFVTASGERRWMLTSKVPFRDAHGKIVGLVGVSRDITERKRAEEERQAIERKFQETQKLESLGVLAGGIAHDFNNLLTGILGNASLARLDLPSQSPVQSYLEAIEATSQRAAELCKQMLAYSGKGRFVIQRVDLSALVHDTLHLLQLSISKKAVLKLELAPKLPAVMADATQLRQIIMNLVINASDAIGERSGVITLRTSRMSADAKYLGEMAGAPELTAGEYVVLEVTDNGCGMSAETQARMFEPFFTTKFTGRGLGLAAVLGIVRGHKGALKVYSELGKGTTFKLLLPAAGGPTEDTRAERRITPQRGSGTILVVDDEEAVRNVTARMLTSMGFRVLSANDGEQGVEIYKAQADGISAVILDLTMPRKDGEETFREIRRMNANAFVILMSGFNEQDAVARFVGKGLAGFIQKPFTPDQLREKLSAFFTDAAQ